MNTLIKPPCTNEGQTTEEQRIADEYLATLANISVVKHKNNRLVQLASSSAMYSVSNLANYENNPCFKDTKTEKVYTFREVYNTCVALNYNKPLSSDEWNYFVTNLFDDLDSDKLLASIDVSLEAAIKSYISLTTEEVSNVFTAAINAADIINEVDNTALFDEAVNQLKEILYDTPFLPVSIAATDVAREYGFIDC